MPDPRFFKVAGPFTVGDIAAITGATPVPGTDSGRIVRDVAPLSTAEPEHLSFLDNRKYAEAFAASRAGVCLVHPDLAQRAPAGMAILVTRTPYKAYALAAQAFYPNPAPSAGLHPSAVVDASAEIGEGCEIGAGVVVAAGAWLGPGCLVEPNAVIGENVQIGAGSRIGAGSSLSHCVIGERVVIYPGVRIGQDGFGFAMDAAGHVRVPQLGRVVVEDDVEVGANTTIDRGAGPDTVIGRGTMIDNLVQIGHNVTLGPGCVVIAQAGISGSSRLGHHTILAAQAGIAGHLTIGPGARIAAQSGVMKDVAAGEEVCGAPAVPIRQFFRQVATLARLSRDGRGVRDKDE